MFNPPPKKGDPKTGDGGGVFRMNIRIWDYYSAGDISLVPADATFTDPTNGDVVSVNASGNLVRASVNASGAVDPVNTKVYGVVLGRLTNAGEYPAFGDFWSNKLLVQSLKEESEVFGYQIDVVGNYITATLPPNSTVALKYNTTTKRWGFAPSDANNPAIGRVVRHVVMPTGINGLVVRLSALDAE